MWEPSPPPVELVRSVPEAATLWIEASPRWRGRTDTPWIDLRSRDLGGAGRTAGRRLRSSDAPPASIYLPPTAHQRGDEVRALAAWAVGLGAALLAHQPAGTGSESDITPPEGCTPVFDLLPVLLAGGWERLGSIPPDSVIVWPLLARLTDEPALVTEGLDRLAGLGVGSVHPVIPTLTPKTRRLLSEHAGERAFDRVFHAGTADPRAFARECLERDLDYLPTRSVAPANPRLLELRVAADLAQIADLWTETGGSEPEAQAFFRAARWFETTERDVRSLWREGNLGVVPWIDDPIEIVVAELAQGAPRSTLLCRLAGDWPRRH